MESKKNILIATKFFYPDITPRAFRAFELAKEFSRRGHHVEVLIPERNYCYRNLESKYGFMVKARVKPTPSLIQGNKVKAMIRFGLEYFFLYPHILLMENFRNALEKEKGHDLLLSIAYPYPVHFGVAKAISKNRHMAKVWVADCGDPFLKNSLGRLEPPFYFRYIEEWFCGKPDYITVPVPEAKQAYPKKFENKIRVIPQGFDFDDVPQNHEEPQNPVPTFAYAGNLSPGLRDPRKLLEFLHRQKAAFKFIIYTKNEKFLLDYEKKLGAKLELRAFVPRNQLLSELGQMDFLVNFENGNSFQKPSKLIDYALLKRPILSLRSNDFNPQLVIDFLDGKYESQYRVENVEEYHIEKVAQQFLDLI
ncbi:glycosyltransferase [Echinicola sp. CAU 1574]|uniref:Glycosyltransferase n=1 Tax=Echinicola arenosa TaxID=2774144 RepID=A0ABR9AND4_9BACT|nr:glycosyltransferase [Echinicola arenosa]MBD8490059.1 glycosyltransferase [Echinicola arenosa]